MCIVIDNLVDYVNASSLLSCSGRISVEPLLLCLLFEEDEHLILLLALVFVDIFNVCG